MIRTRWNSLEEPVLCLSVELIDAQLEHLQTSGSLISEKNIVQDGKTVEYSYKANTSSSSCSHLPNHAWDTWS